MKDAAAFLELRGLTKGYGAVAALADVSLAVPRGGKTAVVGPSGSGKSTLLRILAGFDAPDRGEVRLDGQVLANGPRIVPAHLRGIGLVAQEGALFPHLSVADNIGFGLALRARDRAARVKELADLVGLDGAMLRRMPDALSGGQQQRVALARALACQPRLMLLDEPFSALDTGLRDSTRRAVAELLGETGVTTVLVTHDQAEALSFADQVAVLHDGRLLQAGTPREVYLRPRDERVARFLGDAVILPAELRDGWAYCALGRLSVGNACLVGPGRVMLRLEQLSVVPLGPGYDPRSGAVGVVEQVQFGGASCGMGVRLRSGPGASEVLAGGADQEGVLLTLRSAQNATPSPGTPVRIEVAGEAHVFRDGQDAPGTYPT